jgi:hypothetical protein
MVKEAAHRCALRKALTKDKPWEELFASNMEKQASGKIMTFLKNPAGGAGFKGGIKQGLRQVGGLAPTGAGAYAGAKIYEGSEGKAPTTAGLTALLTPWLTRDVKKSMKQVSKKVRKGKIHSSDYANELMAKLVKPTLIKGGTGLLGIAADSGVEAFRDGQEKGPEMAKKLESAVDTFQQTGENVQNITKDVGDVTTGSKKYLTSGLTDLGKGTSSLGKEIGKSGAGVNKALTDLSKTLDESGGTLKNIGDLAETAKKKMEGDGKKGGLDLLGIKGAMQHVKDNSGKYALAGGGLAALAAYVMYRKSKKADKEVEEEARRKEREIRALNRMARATESS